uniref:Low specificity L-threonine aldolase n=1 Tax=Lygus hesperus TaxID=30085 RepID=A0A0A9YFY6_LYGHE
MVANSTLTLRDIASVADAFYIGGTKNGAMFGEAIVICKKDLQPHFRNMIRQNGALLAKGWLLGVQFQEMFKDGLYYQLASHANQMTAILRKGVVECGFHCLSPHTTNQLFFYAPPEVVKRIQS